MPAPTWYQTLQSQHASTYRGPILALGILVSCRVWGLYKWKANCQHLLDHMRDSKRDTDVVNLLSIYRGPGLYKTREYARQQRRHRCIEQSFGLCRRGQGWDGLGEWHWNMYIIICEMDRQSRFDAWNRVLRAGALGWPRRMGWGVRWEGGSGWGTHVHLWWIHVNVWQN